MIELVLGNKVAILCLQFGGFLCATVYFLGRVWQIGTILLHIISQQPKYLITYFDFFAT